MLVPDGRGGFRFVAKRCIMCDRLVSNRGNAKTCGPRCRKRLSRAPSYARAHMPTAAKAATPS